jgi:glycosyltransferase involved in cell wall biosynthesis
MVTEGTYPYHWGGVSTWCHQLLTDLSNIDFKLISLIGDPTLKPAFTLPPNVVDFRPIPMWGVRELLETRSDLSLDELRARKTQTTPAAIASDFIPLFRTFLEELYVDSCDPQRLGWTIHAMYRFFLRYDFDSAMRSQVVWDCFVQTSQAHFPRLAAQHGYVDASFTLADLTTCFQWLYHWFFAIGAPLPVADVVHSAMAGVCTMVAVVARYEYGAVFMMTEHGIYLRERYLAEAGSAGVLFRKLFSLRFARRMTELSYALADQISPCCDYNQRWELRNGAKHERVRTIYYGVDSDAFTPQHKPFGDPPVVVWVGRIDPLKDVLTLLQAAALVHQARPDIQFRLFGSAPAGNEGYYQKCLELRKELGLEETVIFAGFRSNTVSAFNEGDVVVLSSVSEAFPFVILEAMLCEKPVVATKVGGVPEQLQGCGIAVEPRNPEEMAQAILKLMNDPALAEKLGKAARQKAMKEYSTRQSGSAHKLSYRRMFSQRLARFTDTHTAFASSWSLHRRAPDASPISTDSAVLRNNSQAELPGVAKSGVAAAASATNVKLSQELDKSSGLFDRRLNRQRSDKGATVEGYAEAVRHHSQIVKIPPTEPAATSAAALAIAADAKQNHLNLRQASISGAPLIDVPMNQAFVNGVCATNSIKVTLPKTLNGVVLNHNGALNGKGPYTQPVDPCSGGDNWGEDRWRQDAQSRQAGGGASSETSTGIALPGKAKNEVQRLTPEADFVVSEDKQNAWRTQHESMIIELADSIATRCAEPLDALEITALLESMGITDEVAAQRFSAPDVFALGETIFEHLRSTGAQAPAQTQAQMPQPTFKETVLNLARGPLALMPPLLLLAVIALYGLLGGWEQRSLLVLSTGMTTSMLVANGFVQAASRRTSIYLGLQKPKAAGRFLLTGMAVAMGCVAVLGALAVGVTAYFDVLNLAEQQIFLAAFGGLSLLWLLGGALSLVRHSVWLTLGLGLGILAGAAVEMQTRSLTVHHLALGTLIGYGMALLLILIPLWQGIYRSRAKSSTAGVPMKFPSTAYLLHEAWPYFAYGILYMLLILSPHLFGWLGCQPASWGIAVVELALTLAMPPLILAGGVAEHALRLFWRVAPVGLSLTPGGETALFGRGLADFYCHYRRLYLLALAVLSTAALLALQAAAYYGLLERWLQSSALNSLWLFFAGSLLAYGLLGLGIFSCMFCITVGRPQSAIRAVGFGIAVLICLGLLLMPLNFVYSVLAFIGGGLAFAVVAWREAGQIFQSVDYYFASSL